MDINSSNQGPRIRPQDLVNAKDIECTECKHTFFTPVVMIKVVSAIMSPNGKEVHVPIQTFACNKCGNVSDASVT